MHFAIHKIRTSDKNEITGGAASKPKQSKTDAGIHLFGVFVIPRSRRKFDTKRSIRFQFAFWRLHCWRTIGDCVAVV